MDHRVEEVLDQGASEAEIAETLDIGLLMGGTLAAEDTPGGGLTMVLSVPRAAP